MPLALRVAQAFGGGGHDLRAGCSLPMGAQEAKVALLAVARCVLGSTPA